MKMKTPREDRGASLEESALCRASALDACYAVEVRLVVVEGLDDQIAASGPDLEVIYEVRHFDHADAGEWTRDVLVAQSLDQGNLLGHEKEPLAFLAEVIALSAHQTFGYAFVQAAPTRPGFFVVAER